MFRKPQKGTKSANGFLKRFVLCVLLCGLLAFIFVANARADVTRNARIQDYEGRQITAVELVFEGTANQPTAVAEFIELLKVAPNTQFSAVRVRDSNKGKTT